MFAFKLISYDSTYSDMELRKKYVAVLKLVSCNSIDFAQCSFPQNIKLILLNSLFLEYSILPDCQASILLVLKDYIILKHFILGPLSSLHS